MPTTLSRHLPPSCRICSFRQPEPLPKVTVCHRHSSARQVRILQNVEYEKDNLNYLCPSCQVSHLARLPYGLNICISSSQLHEFHLPREEGVVCPPDSMHVDWVTIPGATLNELEFAWSVDYHHQTRPMRILLVAGLNDLIKGGSRETFMQDIKKFKATVDWQNRHHSGEANQFAVAPLPMPPKLVWYRDNGPIPAEHPGSREEELTLINNDIFEFNAQNGLPYVPRLNTLGVRRYKRWNMDGSWQMVVHHRMGQWRATEPRHEKLHLGDAMRVRMGKMVVDYFKGEVEREDGPISKY